MTWPIITPVFTPLRTISLSNISWLLVGGVPSHKFPQTVQPLILHRSASRLWKCDPRTLTEVLGVALPVQSELLWRDDATSTTSQLWQWASESLHHAKLSPLENYEVDFEAYVPGELAKNTTFKDGDHPFQLKRWTRNFAPLHDGRYAIKRLNSFGMGEIRVGQISNGKLSATGSLSIESDDARRLLYGLDLISQSPTTVLIKTTVAGTIFRFRNELPRSQNRLLLALGTLLPQNEGNYYPRDWIIPTEQEETIRLRLASLGIRIEKGDWA